MAEFWPSSLVRELADRRGAIFTGAGLSKLAGNERGLAFPTWNSLLLEMSDPLKKTDKITVKRLINQGRYLDCAQIIWDSLPDADVRAKISSVFGVNTADPPSIFRTLLALDPGVILTTNFDKLMEDAFVRLSPGGSPYNVCLFNQDHALDDIRSPKRGLLKVHGCVSQPGDIILTRKQFFAARKKYLSFFHVVSSLTLTNTVLFLGYSISDPDIQLILEGNNISAPSRNPHYALVPKFEHRALKAALQETYNIHFLEYPAGDYAQVSARITELAEAVELVRSSLGIP